MAGPPEGGKHAGSTTAAHIPQRSSPHGSSIIHAGRPTSKLSHRFDQPLDVLGPRQAMVSIFDQRQHHVVLREPRGQLLVGEIEEKVKEPSGKVRSGIAGAKARAEKLTATQRSGIARKAAASRWS